MLDKNGENASDTKQEKPVNKYFQFHLKKGTECSSHMKTATSTQYHSIKVDETTPTRDVYFEISKETGVLKEFSNQLSSPVILILIKLGILEKYLTTLMTELPKGKLNDSMTKLWKNCRDEELVNEKIKPVTLRFYEIQIRQ